MQSLAEKAENVGSCRPRPATGSRLSLSACQVSRELREKRGCSGGSRSARGDETLSVKKRKMSRKIYWISRKKLTGVKFT